MKIKIIITGNPRNHEGGVTNYYNLMIPEFEKEGISIVRLTFGSRMEHFYLPHWLKVFLYPFFYCMDFLVLLGTLLRDREIQVVQVSPSLIPVPLLRDAPVVLLARLFRKQIVVFFHGWKEYYYEKIRRHPLRRFLFCAIYGRSALTLVLLPILFRRFGVEPAVSFSEKSHG